jgi:hypothetical protein
VFVNAGDYARDADPRQLRRLLILNASGEIRCDPMARRLQPWRGAAGSVPFRNAGRREIAMKLAASRELFAYWNALRGLRSAPERDDVDPGAIRGVLADTFILEFDPAAGFPLRVVGTRTNALFLRELRGEPFLDLWREADRAEIAELVVALADEAQPFLIGAAAAPLGFPQVDVEVLLLPLRRRGDTHARALGCCAPRGVPRWLGLAGVKALTLLTLRALGPSDCGDEPSSGETSRETDFARPPRPARRGHLYLFGSGR